jgi:hypothetical protein
MQPGATLAVDDRAPLAVRTLIVCIRKPVTVAIRRSEAHRKLNREQAQLLVETSHVGSRFISFESHLSKDMVSIEGKDIAGVAESIAVLIRLVIGQVGAIVGGISPIVPIAILVVVAGISKKTSIKVRLKRIRYV